MHHEYGPRRQRCRAALLVAGEGSTSMTDLLAAAWSDFGAEVTLLERPTAQQLQQRLQDMQSFAAEHSWVEALCLYFTGRGYTWAHNAQQLQLLQVLGQDPAAAAAAGASTDSLARVLVAPLEELEAGVQREQVPLLIHIDTVPCSDSMQPSQQQLDAFRDGLRDRCRFSHRVSAMDCADDGALLTWSWLLFKHTFLVWHSSWAAAHAAAAAELVDAGVEAPEPCFASDESNTALFPHGQVPEQHHRVLKLIHDITTAAHAAPRSNHTLHLLTQLSLLLADEGWRPFVLRWGLLGLTAVEADAGGGGAAGTKRLDELMRGLTELFQQEMKLPGALLVLAATDRAETQQAAAAVLRHLLPLADYGILPGELPGKPDAEGRAALGRQLLQVQVKATAASEPRPLCLLPFVAAFLVLEGLETELKDAVAGLGPMDLDEVYTPDAFAGSTGALATYNNSQLHPFSAYGDGGGIDSGSGGGLDPDSVSMPPPPKRLRMKGMPAAAAPTTPGVGGGGFGLQQQQSPLALTQSARHLTIGLGLPLQLPPDTQELSARDLADVTPLLQLPQLSKLRLSGCACSAETLLSLTAVRSLQELSLTFELPRTAAATARVWPNLPVASLVLGGGSKNKYAQYNQVAVMQGLAQLGGLTCLRFSCRMPHLTASGLATTLSRLTNLARLDMSLLSLNSKQPATNQAVFWTQLMRALNSLPRLESLDLACMGHGTPLPGVMHELSGLSSSMTQLLLTSCGVNDASASAIVRGPNLKGLRDLDLSSYSSPTVTDATMGVIASAGLTALTRLRVGTGVTAAGRRLVMAQAPRVRIE